MIAAHDAFLAAWDGGRGHVPSGATLSQAARAETDAGLATWVAERLEDDPESRPAADFARSTARQSRRTASVWSRSGTGSPPFSPGDDPKLALLADVLEGSSAGKIAVFATYGETIAYLDRHLPERVGGRERAVVVGGESTADERTGLLARFSPRTVVAPDYDHRTARSTCSSPPTGDRVRAHPRRARPRLLRRAGGRTDR